ncbi:hypothetical protein HPB48_000487 [Haemaphysalis longicornis]|uniref:Uncharacterized protein n=1 Tax=Haemaphysalis longicornis TaxID=44386 RepID=A0A9J6GR52_HAELO|nr:hypothetical protein HPB48_000487 [Haemaphysalis longicornis]
MAVFASVLLLSSPLEAERTAGRLLITAWLVASFSLATCLQSLLTTTITAGSGWEADNTVDKLYYKLESGQLAPCSPPGFYLDVLLGNAGRGNKRDNIIDAMAAVAHRLESSAGHLKTPHSITSCMEKAAKGTHVFLITAVARCWYKKSLLYRRGLIIEGEEALLAIPTGFAMKKSYYLRHEIDHIARRLVETGWNHRRARKLFWLCQEQENSLRELNPWNIRLFLGVMCIGCSLSAVVLGIELVVGCMPAR